MVSRIGGRHMYLWRAVDDEGEVLGTSVERRRDARTATTFIQKLMRDQSVRPEAIVTDGLGSYVSAVNALGLQALHSPGRLRENNRVENSHLAIRKRERHMQQFKSKPSAQHFRKHPVSAAVAALPGLREASATSSRAGAHRAG